jgi:hypothetical protein
LLIQLLARAFVDFTLSAKGQQIVRAGVDVCAKSPWFLGWSQDWLGMCFAALLRTIIL